jgi:hypothetical protein
MSFACNVRFCLTFLICISLFPETFHMIDKCDSEIATWSEQGDNFVVKNVEKFAGVSDYSTKYEI